MTQLVLTAEHFEGWEAGGDPEGRSAKQRSVTLQIQTGRGELWSQAHETDIKETLKTFVLL